jgi:hypothetical protein
VKPRQPGERSFGLSVGSAFLGGAALAWWRGYARVALVLAGLGLWLVVFGWLWPSALRGPNRIWWRFAQVLGWVNARIILTAFFALVLTPAGIVMRMAGRNPLRAPRSDTNWTPYPARRADPRHFERLY